MEVLADLLGGWCCRQRGVVLQTKSDDEGVELQSKGGGVEEERG